MRSRVFGFVLALIAGLSLWWVISKQPASHSQKADAGEQGVTEIAPSPTLNATSPGTDHADTAVSDPQLTVLPGPVEERPKPVALAARAELPIGPEASREGSGLTPPVLLENLRTVFRQYSQRFGANPVGDNAEITASLYGQNPRRATFINPEDGLRVNDKGELVDNWGTPFFFHQLSRLEMEIHSAGPDRKMWSTDDLVIK